MKISRRQEQLLRILLEQQSYKKISDIAEQMQISKRTVQREFSYLEGFVGNYDLCIATKTGKGVRIEGAEEQKDRLLSDLAEGTTIDSYGREERIKYLLFHLLKEEALEKLLFYSEKFRVSEGTISHDLNEVERWTEQCGIHLVRQAGSAVTITRTEQAYRSAVQRFLQEHISIEELYAYVRGFAKKQEEILQLLDQEITTEVADCLEEIDDERLRQLTEEAYIGLILHLSIAVSRMKKGSCIQKKLDLDGWTEMEFYDLMLEIVQRLCDCFHLQIPDFEQYDILIHLNGSKRLIVSSDTSGRTEQNLRDVIGKMIDVFDPEIAVTMKNDEEFLRGLEEHLKPSIVRMKNNLDLYNPLLDGIQREYKDTYEKAKQAAHVLEEQMDIEVNGDEIGYLTMHFGAALLKYQERRKYERQVNIGVICSSGIGLSRLMQNKLQNELGRRVHLTACAQEDLSPYLIRQQDFFVGAVPIKGLEIDYIRVNPLFTEEDMNRIRQKVLCYAGLTKQQENTDFTRQMDMINEVSASIKNVIQNYRIYPVDGKLSFAELLDGIGQLFGNTEERAHTIREDLLAREKLFSQVYEDMGFALLHCRTNGVQESRFAALKPEQTDAFVDPYLKSVKSLIVMLIPRGQNVQFNTEMMGRISSALIEEDGFLTAICAGNEAVSREKLEKILKQYFREYLEI